MRVLWNSRQPMSVRAVRDALASERSLAYTTVMTVLNRLAKKGRVDREQDGRAWMYRPATTQADLIVAEMLDLLEEAGEEQNVVLGQLASALNAAQREHLGRVLKAHA